MHVHDRHSTRQCRAFPKTMYILEFNCRKDKLKELLVLCRFNFQLIKFPTIISNSRGRKGGELFALMEDSL